MNHNTRTSLFIRIHVLKVVALGRIIGYNKLDVLICKPRITLKQLAELLSPFLVRRKPLLEHVIVYILLCPIHWLVANSTP